MKTLNGTKIAIVMAFATLYALVVSIATPLSPSYSTGLSGGVETASVIDTIQGCTSGGAQTGTCDPL